MENDNNGGNGHKPALVFRQPSGIAIIGQPFAVKGWFPTVLLVCNCEAREPMMIPRGSAVKCASCKKVYTIQQITFLPDGNVNFGIGMMAPDAADETTAKGSILG